MTGRRSSDRPFRLVVSDIDGTLVNKAKHLTQRARAAIEAMHERGIAFTVASARPPAGLRESIEEIGLRTLVGAVNGGAIIQPDLTIVDRLYVPVEAVRTTIRLLQEQGVDPWLFTDDKWFLRDRDGAHVQHEADTIDLEPTVVDDFDDHALSHALKLVGSSHDHPHLARCEAILQATLGSCANASRSQSYYLDITNADANKGGAVVRIAAHLSIPLEHVMTIGDGHNDTPMFGVSGFSVAMGNAEDAVKLAARAVTDTSEEEGFAKAIERYVLDGEAMPRPVPTAKAERAAPGLDRTAS